MLRKYDLFSINDRMIRTVQLLAPPHQKPCKYKWFDVMQEGGLTYDMQNGKCTFKGEPVDLHQRIDPEIVSFLKIADLTRTIDAKMITRQLKTRGDESARMAWMLMASVDSVIMVSITPHFTFVEGEDYFLFVEPNNGQAKRLVTLLADQNLCDEFDEQIGGTLSQKDRKTWVPRQNGRLNRHKSLVKFFIESSIDALGDDPVPELQSPPTTYSIESIGEDYIDISPEEWIDNLKMDSLEFMESQREPA